MDERDPGAGHQIRQVVVTLVEADRVGIIDTYAGTDVEHEADLNKRLVRL